MSEDFKHHIKQTETWKRGLFMLLFAFCFGVNQAVMSAVALLQFLFKLLTGDTNQRLHKLGQGLATYAYQIILYLSFNNDYQPFPLGAWPKGEPKPAKSAKKADSDVDEVIKEINQDVDVDGD